MPGHFLFGIIRTVVERGVPLWAVLQFIWYQLPNALALALPVSMLLASALAMHRLARDSELTAIRAAGIGWTRLLAPVWAIGLLVSGLDARQAFEDTTLLVVSDHGMLEVERRVDLDEALAAADLPATVWGGGGFASVTVEGGEAVADRVVEVARGLGLEAHRRKRAPAALRTGNPRFGAVVVLATPGVALVRTRGARDLLRGLLQGPLRGSHGYRPDEPGMGALFVAAGRGVPAGTKLGEVRAVDIAPTVLALLGVPTPVWMEGRPLEAFRGHGSAEPGS